MKTARLSLAGGPRFWGPGEVTTLSRPDANLAQTHRVTRYLAVWELTFQRHCHGIGPRWMLLSSPSMTSHLNSLPSRKWSIMRLEFGGIGPGCRVPSSPSLSLLPASPFHSLSRTPCREIRCGQKILTRYLPSVNDRIRAFLESLTNSLRQVPGQCRNRKTRSQM